MPIITTQRERQQKLIGVMIGVFFITGVVLYLGVFRGGGEGSGAGTGKVSPDSLTIPQEFIFDTDILKQERFRRLLPYTKLSRDIATGRDNPFIPYSVLPAAQPPPQEAATGL